MEPGRPAKAEAAGRRYRAFLSYSHADAALALRLHRRLEGFRPPRDVRDRAGRPLRRLYPIYRDRDEMAAAASLPDAIRAALAQSDHLIVLCSPAAAASAWVNEEIRLFAALAGADAVSRIRPVIAAGAPPDCFPPALTALLAEPLAPDLQDDRAGQADGFADGALKLIAGLLDTPFGALKNREAARQRRRARINGALAAGFAGLALVSALSAWRAMEETRRAEAEADLAVARTLAATAATTLADNPGESAVAAMIAVDSLLRRPTAPAQAVLRGALARAPLAAAPAPFAWRDPFVTVSADGAVAAYQSAFSRQKGPVRSTVVTLANDLTDAASFDVEGLAAPVYSPEGRRLAVAGRTRRLRVTDGDGGAMSLDHSLRSAAFAAFSPDGAILYAATQTGDVLRWRTSDWSPLPPFALPIEAARRAPMKVVAAGAAHLAVIDVRNAVFVIDVRSGAVSRVAIPEVEHSARGVLSGPIGGVADPTGARVFVYESDGRGVLWDLETRSAIWSIPPGLAGVVGRYGAAISADGALLALAGRSGRATILDMADAAVIASLDHGAPIRAVAYLSDPGRVVLAGDGGASIWSASSEAGADATPLARCAPDLSLHLLTKPRADALAVAGAAEGAAGVIALCDATTGETRALRRFDRPIRSLAAGADGALAATLWTGDLVENWTEIAFVDEATGHERARIQRNGGLSTPILSRDGALAAARDRAGGAIHVWDTATGAEMRRITPDGRILGFSPDGRRLRIARDALVSIDLSTGEASLPMGGPGGVTDMAIFTGGEGAEILTTGRAGDGAPAVWGWSADDRIPLWRAPPGAVVSPDGAAVAVADADTGAMRVRKRATGAALGIVPHMSGTIFSRILTAKGARFAHIARRENAETGALDHEVEIYDVAAGAPVFRRRFAGDAISGAPALALWPGNRLAIFTRTTEGGAARTEAAVIDLADGAALWSLAAPGFASLDLARDRAGLRGLMRSAGGATLHDLATGAPLWTAQETPAQAAFSPDGARVAALHWPDQDDAWRYLIHDAATGAVLRKGSGPPATAEIVGLAFVAGGTGEDAPQGLVFADGAEASSGLWFLDLATGATRHLPLDARPAAIAALATPDRIAVRDRAGAVRILSFPEREETLSLAMAVRSGLEAVAGDADRAATAQEGTIRLWRASTGEERARLRTAAPVSALAISPDGAAVAYLEEGDVGAAGTRFDALGLWRPDGGAPPLRLPMRNAARLVFDPTGVRIAVLDHRGEAIRVLDARTLATLHEIMPLRSGALAPIDGAPAIFTADGRHLVVMEKGDYSQSHLSAPRRAVRAFRLDHGAETLRFDIAPTLRWPVAAGGALYYPRVDGRLMRAPSLNPGLDRRYPMKQPRSAYAFGGTDRIFVSSDGGDDRLVDLAAAASWRLAVAGEDVATVSTAISPDGAHIALSTHEAKGGELRIFDGRTGALLARRALPTPYSGLTFIDGDRTVLMTELGGLLTPAMVDRARLLAWRWREDRLETLIDDNPVTAIAASADGAVFATAEGGEDWETETPIGVGRVRLWRAGEAAARLVRPHDLFAPRIAVSGDGRRLAILSAASPTRGEVIEVGADGAAEVLLRIEREDGAQRGRPVGFAAGGDVFVMGERSGARIYDLRTGAAVRLREAGKIDRHALSPDGALLALAGDGGISVWRLDPPERIARAPIEDVYRLLFAGRDGRRLIAVKSDGAHEIAWRPEALVETACDVFAADRWRAGRLRLTGEAGPGPCAEAQGAR